MKNKQLIRKKYLKIRNNISNKENKSEIIFNNIIGTDEYQKAKIIALYKSLPSEVSTDKLIDYSIAIGKIVALPKIIDNEIVFYQIDNKSIFVKSSFGVLEPLDNNHYISKEKFDLFIIPGVCFDQNKNRLGFGKGYYDRYLNDTKAIKIGICFEEQITDNIPTEDNDIKMDLIITDKVII